MERNGDNLPEAIADGITVLMKNVMRESELGTPSAIEPDLEYWEKVTGRKAEKCAHEICNRPATHAAIATRAFSADKTRYIYPACETCVRRTEMLYVKGPVVPID